LCFILSAWSTAGKDAIRNHKPTIFCRQAGKIFLLTCIFFLLPDSASLDDSVAASLNFSPSPADAALPEGVDTETGYRMEHYRRPAPDINPGTELVNTERALELHQSGKVVFIDVYPPRGLGADPIDGSWRNSEAHETIEGSTWLPEVGRGYLEPDHVSYFERNLELLSNGDKKTPLLFYCTADCWQGWNAARRALRWGYEIIFWYPNGSDGWLEEGHALVPAEAVNFFDE